MHSSKPPVTHPLWLRLTHWVAAFSIIIMVLSGWRIYNASPIFPFRIPADITLGGWLGGALLWHFAAMWSFVACGLIYLIINITSGRMRAKFFPLRLKEFFDDLWQAMCLKLEHDDLTHYNMVQKVAYLVAIAALIVLVASGLVIWKPVQFPWLRTLMGDYNNARIVHFCAMTVVSGFILIHVTLVALVPRTLLGMLRGRV